MQCGYQLKWYDMIPIFSYLFLGGKCRKCKCKLSIQYPLTEAVNGILYLLIFGVYGFTLTSVIYCLMTSALLALAVIDARTMEIPFGINVFLFVLGVLRVFTDGSNWPLYVIGCFAVSVPFGLLYVLSKGRAIGGGDVKLMAAAGLILGWKLILLALALGSIIGSVIHILRMKLTHANHQLAFGPYLAIGIFLAAMWGDTWIRMYLEWIL